MVTSIPIHCDSVTSSPQLTAVQVALRVRPLTQQDKAQPRFVNSTASDVIRTVENSVVVVPHQKSFHFDHVFDSSSTQEDVFSAVGSKLVDRFLEGYNVTILAYGQTCSGKTYTMGTALDNQKDLNPKKEGIIPRAISALFEQLEKDQQPTKNVSIKPIIKRIPSLVSTTTGTGFASRKSKQPSSIEKLKPASITSHRGSTVPSISSDLAQNDKKARYTVHVSFIEIHNEELIDLLNPAPAQERSTITIREDAKGQIIWTGLKEIPVTNTNDVLRHLRMGTENRATGSTDMNSESSRSHAIFSVTLKQEKWVASAKKEVEAVSTTRNNNHSMQRNNTLNVKAMIGQMERRNSITEDKQGEWMVTQSKFHFVDLAGSERLKRTAAEGDRRKEGININAGLSALGNVICALSDPQKKPTHVPYRDSKLTRLLQDSLGGNATTLMIACVSPAEADLIETTNTLKYACRARNIRNKSEKNETEEWMTNDNVDYLRQLITKLKSEIRGLKSQSRSTPSPQSSASKSLKIKSVGYPSYRTASVSSSSLSLNNDSDVCLSCSSSATTQNTMLETPAFPEKCQNQDASNDTSVLVSDLRRQIEELQNELSVTWERNMHMEKGILQPNTTERSKTSSPEEFQHLVEPVIEEYEKSISGLELQLAAARMALSQSDQALSEQKAKIAEHLHIQKDEAKAIHALKSHLSAALERERSSETYCTELEVQLQKSIQEGQKDQKVLSELREKIIKFKEMDSQTEKYISDLESRLSSCELERDKLLKEIASITAGNKEEPSATEAAQQKQTMEEKLTLSEAKCEELKQQITDMKEYVKLQESEYAKSSSKIDDLSALLNQKESEVKVLESKINEIGQLENELVCLRQTHSLEIERLEVSLHDLKKAHQAEMSEQKHQEKVKVNELTKAKNELELHLQAQEEQNVKQKQEEFGKLQKAIHTLSSIDEKQTALIQGLERKLEETNHLLDTLCKQLEDRDNRIKLLETEAASKADIAVYMQKQLEATLKEVETIGSEKKGLEKVMQVMEKILQTQEQKDERNIETLQEIKNMYEHHKLELDEKANEISMISKEKKELSELLKHVSQRASQSNSTIRSLTIQLNEARELAPSSDASTHDSSATLLEISAKTESKEEIGDHQVQKCLTKTEELKENLDRLGQEANQNTILHSKENLSNTKSESAISLEFKTEQDTMWKKKAEKAEQNLLLSLKENKHYKDVIDILEASLEQTKKQLKRQDSMFKSNSNSSLSSSSISLVSDNKQSDFKTQLNAMSCDSLSQHELVERIVQLQEDNNQLVNINDDLESQLLIQRNHSALETKNLELELMKLAAINDRLEREMEQVLPPRKSSLSAFNRDAGHITSPPQTPRISSPLLFNQTNGNTIHHKMQREPSSPNVSRLSKSSLRSPSVALIDTNRHHSYEESNGMSFASAISDITGSSRASLTGRYSKTHFSSAILPPPTAPPCNPLPPIPSPLPALPTPNESHMQENETRLSPPLTHSVEASSYFSLRRQDSVASSTFSEVMSASSITSLDSEKYERIVRSLQRKTQAAENDVKTYQDVICKLETQLLRSESSVLEVKKQLDRLSREKQAYNLEINNLRSQVSQIQSHQMASSQESLHERKELEDKLKQQKELKEKAEKARRILENRMNELMNRKSKFMCF
ncbi:hypothetical protein BD560DRAFT_419831 [Blakeslea trispora]|nr:hypothetical protein BD560DRAFT_419831 [Blakeslea trispora]